MDQGTRRLWAERAVRAVGCTFPLVEFSTWPVCERLLPQALVCAEFINQWGFEFREAAKLLNDLGLYLSDLNIPFRETMPAIRAGRAITEKVNDKRPKLLSHAWISNLRGAAD